MKIYNFADLKGATKSFKSDYVLDIGCFDTVFKGWVDEGTLAPSKYGIGTIVAIKKLNPEVMQGFEEWQIIIYYQQDNEVVTFMRIWIIGTKGFFSYFCRRNHKNRHLTKL